MKREKAGEGKREKKKRRERKKKGIGGRTLGLEGRKEGGREGGKEGGNKGKDGWRVNGIERCCANIHNYSTTKVFQHLTSIMLKRHPLHD